MKRIYLVEDNEEINELIALLLNNLEFEVKNSLTLSGFRKHLAHTLPDLILLDVMLPDGNGIDVCRELKSDVKTKDIPVLLMSAHVNVKTKALEAQADDFIEKPFDINDFKVRILKQVEN